MTGMVWDSVRNTLFFFTEIQSRYIFSLHIILEILYCCVKKRHILTQKCYRLIFNSRNVQILIPHCLSHNFPFFFFLTKEIKAKHVLGD